MGISSLVRMTGRAQSKSKEPGMSSVTIIVYLMLMIGQIELVVGVVAGTRSWTTSFCLLLPLIVLPVALATMSDVLWVLPSAWNITSCLSEALTAIDLVDWLSTKTLIGIEVPERCVYISVIFRASRLISIVLSMFILIIANLCYGRFSAFGTSWRAAFRRNTNIR